MWATETARPLKPSPLYQRREVLEEEEVEEEVNMDIYALDNGDYNEIEDFTIKRRVDLEELVACPLAGERKCLLAGGDESAYECVNVRELLGLLSHH